MFFPKIGLVGYRNSRKIEGEPKNVTISRKGKHWFVSVQVEIEAIEKQHPSKSFVGIDMGVKCFATLSTRKFYTPLNSFKKKQTKLAKLQRKLKNKVKFSNNWKKLQAKIGELHISISNARHDYTHKISSQISKSHAVIVIENLSLKNMTKSATGNADKHGKKLIKSLD
ncbi:MAG: transposase [Methylococcaceae bacterium]|jgi:putative transposase|nr:transposase [Methylococcaceae bacterium]MDZ4155034.1 transposase [Methylococcales bacterium]MDP2394521.1 transposase [Methylococcaceae bacterium]MDP3021564.1 transposase [Methylococcaceae bacterium]MDP3392072.1 transposase [Methylococcaceae bacterium]